MARETFLMKDEESNEFHDEEHATKTISGY
jgi:hypothetical protein